MAAAKDDISLLEHLDVSQINCLNEERDHDLKSILASKKLNAGSAYLESSADAQLLLSIHFNQAVRIRTLVLRTKDSEPSHGPKTLKLLVNKPAISFGDVDGASDSAFAQVFTLSEEDLRDDGRSIALKFVRFTNVNSLHIFVESNQSDNIDTKTRINAIDVLGVPVEATKNLSGLKQEEE